MDVPPTRLPARSTSMLHRVHTVVADDEVGLLTVKVTCSTDAPLKAAGIGETEETCTRSAP